MALVLTRRPGQKIILDRPHIEITLDSIVGKTAKLRIVAPKHVRVIREELILRIEPTEAKS